ncbi:caspase domain-containing protein [Nocardia salmonicida]|uniref:caspase domain-containing protein n=1 Tax=Nocardia salmonicida TaxID=53431 RepID=UPI003797405D
MWMPDGLRSRAVLIGTSHYSHDGLADLPAVERNVSDLSDILAAHHGLRLPSKNCQRLVDIGDPRAVLTAVHAAAAEAEDLLLVYFAGHGLVDSQDNLFLGLADSPRPLDQYWLAVDIRDLRTIMNDSNSRAANRVLILDCCFSGRAFEAMGSGAAASAIEAMGVRGTFTMTSTPENETALAPVGGQHTAFTGALIELLDTGVADGPEFLTLDTIYEHTRNVLVSQGLPEPRRRCVDGTGALALVRNNAWYDSAEDRAGHINDTTGARYRELSQHPSYPTIRRLVGWYISACIPDWAANQRERWNVVAMPSTNVVNGRRLVTVTCGRHEVLFISEVTRPNGSRTIVAVCNIAAPADKPPMELNFHSEYVFGRVAKYERVVWAWQFDLVEDITALRGPIRVEEFVDLARQLNDELMQSKSPSARFHNPEFAGDLLLAALDNMTEERRLFDSLTVVVDRADVESGNIGPTLKTLQRLTSSPAEARAAQGTLSLVVDGYNDATDELFEIIPVRTFIQKLDERFPFWLFFSSTHTTSLSMIVLCFLPPFLTREGMQNEFPARWDQLMRARWIPALNHMANYAGLDDVELRQRSEAALGYFTGPRNEILL